LTFCSWPVIIFVGEWGQPVGELRKEVPMSKVGKIKAAIEALGEEDYSQLRRWFSERDWEKWDR